MARLQNVSGDELFVPTLNRVVPDGDVVEVPDADFESWYPPDEHRGAGHPWDVVEAPADSKTRKTRKPKPKE